MQRILLAAIAAALSCSCTARLARPRVASGLKEAVRQLRYTPEAFEADYAAYRTAVSPEHAKVIRDQMIHRILAETELYYRDYETRLFTRRSRLGFVGEASEISLAAGASLVNGARGKTVLSTLLTAATGTRLSFDQNFFQEKTTETILAQIATDRRRIRGHIVRRLEESVGSYSFEAAWVDLVDLFYSGTLEGGLQSLHRRVLDDDESR